MFIRKCTAVALALGLSTASWAQLVVVVNPSNNNSLDPKTIQRIFLGKEKKFPDGSETLAVNQVAENDIRQSFDESLLGRSSSQVSAYWSKLVFTGKGIPPKEVSSDAEVLALVAKNPSVIGYIDASSVTADVKVIDL